MDTAQPGDVVGGYRVVEKLGQGGMGVVFAAEHERLGSKAAIKFLLPAFCKDKDIVIRFFNEAKAATRIEHPAIVKVFDFGHQADGSAYFVMEFLAGESLAARLRSRRSLTDTEVATLGRQIASALGAAHAAGIVHRDLKPDNIFLVRDPDIPGGERVKILDFGIAKLRGENGPVQTSTGSLMGTPYYMSPEQCRSARNVDARSDVYALGCILFEMACGRPPFLGEGLGAILSAHQNEQPPSPQTLAPTLPPPMATLISRCLAKNPEQRPQSMSEILPVLETRADLAATRPPTSERAVASTTTLGGAAAQVTSAPVPVRSRGVWYGLAAVTLVGAAVAATLLLSSRSQHGNASPQPAVGLVETGASKPSAPAVEAPTSRGAVAEAPPPTPAPAPAAAVEKRSADVKPACNDATACLAGCERGAAGDCLVLGSMYENGMGAPMDLPRAGAFYQRACDAGEPRACDRAAALKKSTPVPPAAKKKKATATISADEEASIEKTCGDEFRSTSCAEWALKRYQDCVGLCQSQGQEPSHVQDENGNDTNPCWNPCLKTHTAETNACMPTYFECVKRMQNGRQP